MKKMILSSIVFMIYINCHGQTKLVPGEINIKHDTFVIFTLKPVDSIKYIGIYSNSNKYKNGVPYTKAEKNRTFVPMDFRKDLHVNQNVLKQIIYNKLSNKLNSLKSNKETMRVNIEFEPNGKVTDIIFTLKENTNITLEDIEQIDQKIRRDINATFTGENYKQYIAIDYYLPVIVF